MLEQNRFTYETGGAPSRAELQFWDEELGLFEYQAPDPNARSEARRRGWGFESHLKPPVDCWDFVVASIKREWGVRLSDRIRPEVKYSVLMTLRTYFAWLRTQAGTRWLLELYGIRIIPPHLGQAYFYQGERLIEPQYELRIYQVDTSARIAQTPDEYCGPKLLDWLRTTLEERRGPSSKTMQKPGDIMWRWTGTALRNWLIEKEPDRNWPHPKPERISGYLWARELLRPGSKTDYVWTVFGKSEVYRDNRIYRIQRPGSEERLVGGIARRVPPENPGVVWVDRKDMRIVPLDELDQHMGVAQDAIDARYRCRSCGQVRCCTTAKGGTNDRLCMNCRGTQLESGDRRSLLWCQYRECRRCPEHLRNPEDLINLISRLNYSSTRVQRP